MDDMEVLGKMLMAVLAQRAEEEDRRRKAHARRKYPKDLRLGLLSAQQHRCAICLGPMGYFDSHVDHIVPRAAGGGDETTNLQLVHMSCNLRKGPRREVTEQERLPWA